MGERFEEPALQNFCGVARRVRRAISVPPVFGKEKAVWSARFSMGGVRSFVSVGSKKGGEEILSRNHVEEK